MAYEDTRMLLFLKNFRGYEKEEAHNAAICVTIYAAKAQVNAYILHVVSWRGFLSSSDNKLSSSSEFRA